MIIKKRKHTKLICPICNMEYWKADSEIKRNATLNRLNFCTNSCTAQYRRPLREDLNNYAHSKNNIEHLRKLNMNKPVRFAYYINNTVRKRQEVTIDEEYLKNLWETQQSICPYTGIKLSLRTQETKINHNTPYIYASLDRIDSSLGYIPGNVEFVSSGINLLKNKFSKKSVLDFINGLRHSVST